MAWVVVQPLSGLRGRRITFALDFIRGYSGLTPIGTDFYFQSHFLRKTERLLLVRLDNHEPVLPFHFLIICFFDCLDFEKRLHLP